MGKRGPPPAPTALKLLRGEKKADRLNHAEPKAPPGAPPRVELSARAQAIWDRLEPDLLAMGVLARVDDGVLASFCEAQAEWEHAVAQLATTGGPVVAGGIISPWCKVRDAAFQRMKIAGGLLGLSASARSSIHAAPPGTPKPSGFDDLVG